MSGPESPPSDLRSLDAAARRAAQREFERPIVVEAGAGTGKTATLVARVLAWCLGPGWKRAEKEDPDAEPARIAERVLRGVVAITFTEAAAAEMDARIERGLATLAEQRPLIGFDCEAPPGRVLALRSALDQLVVQTIHAYCRRLISSWPLEAGVHPSFEVDADASALQEAVRDVASEQLGARYLARDPDLLALAARGLGPGEIEATLLEQLDTGVNSEDLAEDPLSAERCAALQARLLQAHQTLARVTGGRLDGLRGKKAQGVHDALPLGQRRLEAPLTSAAEIEQLKQALAGVWGKSERDALDKWGKGRPDAFSQAEQAALGEDREAVSAAARELWDRLAHLDGLEPEVLARLGPVLSALAAEVEERLRRRGRIGFDGLLARASALLSKPEVAARQRGLVDQLLVDEFQDTDPRQCAIVAALALTGPAEKRPGLFLVGDPKQSIYGWRSADLDAYETLLRRVQEAGGHVERLTVNFRSVPAVLDVVENAIAPVMRREQGLQPAFGALVPSPALASASGFSADGRAPVEFWIPALIDDAGVPIKTRGSDACVIEARAVARDLRALHEQHGVAWKDVGLLFRSRGEWDVYLGALREAEIPYIVEGDRSYFRRREILDASALVACVLDPNDGLALVALLRSSLAGVPDAAWIPLWAGGLPALAAKLGEDPGALASAQALVAKVGGELDPRLPGLSRIAGWEHAAAAALESVAELRRAFVSAPGDVFVERLRSLTAFEGVEAARTLGHWRASNLDRFFSGLAADLAEPGSVATVLRRIRRAVAEEELPSVEPATRSEADAVSVVTLHGAKGLDWDHVYLMQLHKGELNQKPPQDAGRVEGRLEARWCKRSTLGYDLLLRRRKKVSDAERVRTLYVGMTRARQRLVVSGLWPVHMKGPREKVHAHLLERGFGAGIDLSALAAAADARGASRQHGVLWRFVAREAEDAASLEPSRGQRRAGQGGSPALVDPTARSAAAPRMARRRGMAVTSLADVSAAEAPLLRAGRGSATGRQVGTAIHAALERVELDGDLASNWAEQGARLEADLRRELPTARVEAAVEAARSLWNAIGGGPLAERLREIAPRLIARELPVLLALDEDPEASGLAEFASGAIDLLYRDLDGSLVVVDYKTDRRDPDADAEQIADTRARYARQGALYCRAVGLALRAETPPRFELWWLRSGEVEIVAAP